MGMIMNLHILISS